jgi:serine/threonine protein kinase
MHGIRKVGRYELLELLGRGGMADVYLAHVSGIGDFKRLFAVKMIRTDLPQWERYGQFFIDEARITVQMRHPNIVQVFDLGMSEYGPYLGMEYVDGPDVRQLIGWSSEMRQGVPFNLAVFITRELLQALAYAHEAEGEDGKPLGIVHRDISPSNVLLSTSGEVKLSDFGVAMANIASQAQGPGAVVGKARYFAPEVARREPATPRSDQFSIGAVLFDLFTGQSLIEGEHYTEIVANLEVFDVERRLDGVYSIPTALEKLFLKALAKDPADRFTSVGTMLNHLDDYIFNAGLRVGRVELAEYLKQLEQYIITNDSGSMSGISGISERDLSSIWTANRGDNPEDVFKSASVVPARKRAGNSQAQSPPPTLPPAIGRLRPASTLTGAPDSPAEPKAPHVPQRSRPAEHTVSMPPLRPRPTREADKPKSSPAPAAAAPQAAAAKPDPRWEQGEVLALPEYERVKLVDPATGPVDYSEDDFDDLLDREHPLPDALLSFDHGGLRPFHEWARMGNPRTSVHPLSVVAHTSPLSVGVALARLLTPTSGEAVVQLFDGRQAVGLIADNDRIHGVWTEKLPAVMLAHLAERDVISRSQYQVLSNLAQGDEARIPELAVQHGILSTVRLFHEARQSIQEQLERLLTWPTWRLNRISVKGAGWGVDRAGISLAGGLERAARSVFSLKWFMGLMPDIGEASIRAKQRQVADQLDRLLGKGTLRVQRDLPAGSKVRDAVMAPNGSMDEDRTRNLYELIVLGQVELAIGASRGVKR